MIPIRLAKAPRAKYGNHKVVVDGIAFDSKAEAARWQVLTYMQRAGHISELRRQVRYELVKGVKFDGAKRAQPALRLTLDFAYMERGVLVLEDTKSPASCTTSFVMRRHLLLAIHGLQVRLTK